MKARSLLFKSLLLLLSSAIAPFALATPPIDLPTSLTADAARDSLLGSRTSPGPLAKELQAHHLTLGAPAFIRLFKQTFAPGPSLEPNGIGVLELWLKRSQSNRYTLFKRYPIDNFSGTLGPKLSEGDLQAPEGFYQITPEQLNPNSRFQLSMNIGYPNPLDIARGRTGGLIMIHGVGRSEGCYAMSSDAIAEIYVIAEAALHAGQTAIPVHAFPFPLNQENIRSARTRSNSFQWQTHLNELREGYQSFEDTKAPPLIEFTADGLKVKPDKTAALQAPTRSLLRN